MKIANIVSNNNISVSEEFNVVKSIDEIIDRLPTLIIGFDYVNKHYPDFNILDIELEPNLYWTVKKTERRDKHVEDLTWFINKVYNDLTKNIKYVFIDPLQYNSKSLYKIVRKLYSIEKLITLLNDDMVYIYGENFIFGVDLKLMKYIGYDKIKLINKIKKISSVFLDEKNTIIEYKNHLNNLGYEIKYLPFLYSIRN
jgi:uncharacterized protein (UPF0335 family)